MPNTEFKKKSPKLEFTSAYLQYLRTCLITFKRLEAKQRNKWLLNFTTITNSPMKCAFSGPEVCLHSAPCPFFYLKDYGHLLHFTRPWRCINYSDRHFPCQASQNYFRKCNISGETLVCPQYTLVVIRPRMVR